MNKELNETLENLRENLGKKVREEWILWAKEQPNPKPSWLVEWDALSEPDKEVDRRIGVAIYAMAAGACPASPTNTLLIITVNDKAETPCSYKIQQTEPPNTFENDIAEEILIALGWLPPQERTQPDLRKLNLGFHLTAENTQLRTKVKELEGLLRVAHGQRDDAERRAQEYLNRLKIDRLKDHIDRICRKCGGELTSVGCAQCLKQAFEASEELRGYLSKPKCWWDDDGSAVNDKIDAAIERLKTAKERLQ